MLRLAVAALAFIAVSNLAYSQSPITRFEDVPQAPLGRG
jgi:hypothetical protein